MSIESQMAAKPSVDGLGVKRWVCNLDGGISVAVFQRPRAVLPHRSSSPFMLRISGRRSVLDTLFASKKSSAIRALHDIEMAMRSGRFSDDGREQA